MAWSWFWMVKLLLSYQNRVDMTIEVATRAGQCIDMKNKDQLNLTLILKFIAAWPLSSKKYHFSLYFLLSNVQRATHLQKR